MQKWTLKSQLSTLYTISLLNQLLDEDHTIFDLLDKYTTVHISRCAPDLRNPKSKLSDIDQTIMTD